MRALLMLNLRKVLALFLLYTLVFACAYAGGCHRIVHPTQIEKEEEILFFLAAPPVTARTQLYPHSLAHTRHDPLTHRYCSRVLSLVFFILRFSLTACAHE